MMAKPRVAFYAAAVVLWPAVPAAAVGAVLVRDAVLSRVLNDALSHLASCLVGPALVALVAAGLVTLAQPQPPRRWLAAGVIWAAISVAFHVLYGRLAMGWQWATILGHYNVLRGKLWPLVVLTALVAPIVLAAAGGKVRRGSTDRAPQT